MDMDEVSIGKVGSAVLILIFYPIFGFVGTALLATLYNFVAKRLGGIEFTIASEPFPPTRGLFPVQAPNVDDQLRTLSKLKDDGLITEEEFSQKKKTLLGI
jgi:hypothetical protein